ARGVRADGAASSKAARRLIRCRICARDSFVPECAPADTVPGSSALDRATHVGSDEVDVFAMAPDEVQCVGTDRNHGFALLAYVIEHAAHQLRSVTLALELGPDFGVLDQDRKFPDRAVISDSNVLPLPTETTTPTAG